MLGPRDMALRRFKQTIKLTIFKLSSLFHLPTYSSCLLLALMLHTYSLQLHIAHNTCTCSLRLFLARILLVYHQFIISMISHSPPTFRSRASEPFANLSHVHHDLSGPYHS